MEWHPYAAVIPELLLKNANLRVILLYLQLSSNQMHNPPHNPVEYNTIMGQHGTESLPPEVRGSDSGNNSMLQSQGNLGFPPPSHLHMARNQNQQGSGGGFGRDSQSRQSGGTSVSQSSPTLKSTQLPATLLQGSLPPYTTHHAAVHASSGGQFVGEPMQTTAQPNSQQVNMHQYQYQQQMRQPMQHSSQQHPYYMQVQIHPNLLYRQQAPGNMPMYADGYLPASHMNQGQVESHLGTMLPGSSLQPATPLSTMQPVVSELGNHPLSPEQSQQLPLQQPPLVQQQQGQTQQQWPVQQQQPQSRTRNIIAIIDPKTGLDITKSRREQGSPAAAPVSAADQPPAAAAVAVQENGATDKQAPGQSAVTPTPAPASSQDTASAFKAKEFYDMVAAAAGKSGAAASSSSSSETTKPKKVVGSSQDVAPKPKDDLSHSAIDVVGSEKRSAPDAQLLYRTGETTDDAGLSFGNFGSEDLPPSVVGEMHHNPAAKSKPSAVLASDHPRDAENEMLSRTANISFSGAVVQETAPTGLDWQPKEEKIVTRRDTEYSSTEAVNFEPSFKDSTGKVGRNLNGMTGEVNSNIVAAKEGLKQGGSVVDQQPPLQSRSRLVEDSKSVNLPHGDATAHLKGDSRESEALPLTAALSSLKLDSGLPKAATDDHEKGRSPAAIVAEMSVTPTPDNESLTKSAASVKRDGRSSLEKRASEMDQMKPTSALPSQSSTASPQLCAAGKPNRMAPTRRNSPMDFSARSLRPGGGGLRPGGGGKVSIQFTNLERAASVGNHAESSSLSHPRVGGGVEENSGSTHISSLPGKIVYTFSELRQFSYSSDRPSSLPIMDVSDISRGGGGDRAISRGSMGGAYRGGDARSASRGGGGGGATSSGGSAYPDGRSGQYAQDATGRGGVTGGRMGSESHGGPPAVAAGGGPDWKRGQRLPPSEKKAAASWGGGGGGSHSGGDGFDGPIEPLKKGENRWKPTKDNTPVEEARKKMQGILNKMTRERFDRLNQQLLNIKIECLEMLNILVDLVFDKAVEEHHFVDMYADICSRLVQESSRWSFVKAIYNMDANQWCWTPDVGEDKMVVGPFDDIKKALEFVRSDEADVEPIPTPFDMKLVAFRIFSGKFVKIVQGKELEQAGQLYIVYMDEKKGRNDYQISEDAFGSEDEALQRAAKKTSLRTVLICKCQNEFEKDDIYERLVKEEAEFKANRSSMDKKLFEEKEEEFVEHRIKMKRRIVGNIQFIGELYKKELLKETIIHKCCCKLLNAQITDKGTCSFINNKVDEENLECLCKLLTTTGKKVSSEKQGKRVAEYFRLLEKICKDKKKNGVSSRTIFMIHDLVDLRANDWTPRHKVEKAKTLDELHKEAASDERNRMLGGGLGGRGSDTGRIGSRSQIARDRDFERDRERERLRQGNFDDERSGSLRGNMMMRGDSGGHIAPGGGGPLTSRTFSSTGSSSAAIRDRGGVGGRQQQQQQQHPPSASQVSPYSSAPNRVAYPSSSSTATAAAAPASSTGSSMSSEKIERLVKTLIDEFLSMKDIKEAVECLNELPATQGPRELVRAAALRCMDGKPSDRPLLLQLMTSLFRANAIDPRAAKDGLFPALEQLDDIFIDQPQAPRFLAELLAVVFKEGKIEMMPIVLHSKEKCSLQTLGKLFSALLRSLLDSMGPREAREQLRDRGFNLPDLYASKDEGMHFIHENNLWALFPSMKVHAFISADPSAVDLSLHSALTIVEQCTREMGQDVRASEEWADSITELLLMKSAKLNLRNVCGGTPKSDLFKALKKISSEGGNLTKKGCLWGAFHTCVQLKGMNHALNEIVVPLFRHLLSENIVTVETYRMWRIDVLYASGHKEDEAICRTVLTMLDPLFLTPTEF